MSASACILVIAFAGLLHLGAATSVRKNGALPEGFPSGRTVRWPHLLCVMCMKGRVGYDYQ